MPISTDVTFTGGCERLTEIVHFEAFKVQTEYGGRVGGCKVVLAIAGWVMFVCFLFLRVSLFHMFLVCPPYFFFSFSFSL